MKIKKRIITCMALICGVFIIGSIGYKNVLPAGSVSIKESCPVIIIDAGHGGFDGGAVANDGTVEKDINLKISLALEQFLKQAGYKTVMTRTTDSATDDVETKVIAARKKSDLKNRVSLMKEYPNGIFVSIHLNKFTTSAASGAQVFYSQNSDNSMELGESIQAQISSMMQPENKRVIKKGTSSTYLLKNATIPTVIVECGFLSNKRESELLKNEEYQQKMAFCVFCGILNYYKE